MAYLVTPSVPSPLDRACRQDRRYGILVGRSGICALTALIAVVVASWFIWQTWILVATAGLLSLYWSLAAHRRRQELRRILEATS